ncbi:MFS transporter [Deinococcus sp.]|uniref:MFS transporter n=1 Tax=Deinococcus sp. TaxID=47478 RepID=UPI003C7D4AAA
MTPTVSTEAPPAVASVPAVPEPAFPEALARRTMRLSLLEGGFAMFFINWTSGSVLTGYALHLGATPTALGLIASVPLLGQAVSPLAAWLVGRRGRRKGVAVATALIGRGVWVLAATLPLLPVPDEARGALLVALVALSSLFIAANGALWTAWMGDVVPWKERGRYFGLRTGVLGVVGTAANLIAGTWLDRVAAPLSFQAVLLTATALGLVAAYVLKRHDEPPLDSARLPMSRAFSLPMSDRTFRRLLVFAVYWAFAIMVSSPFLIPYFLNHLKMSYVEVAIWSAISAASALVLAPAWGRLTDRVGNRPVLAVTTFLAGTLLPLTWMLAAPGRLWPIWVSGVVDALVWSAINPGIFNLSLATTPRENRAAFIAVFSALTGVSGFIGGLVSGPLLELYRAIRPAATGWTAYHTLFATSAVLRMLAWTLLRRVPEEGAWRTRDLLSRAHLTRLSMPRPPLRWPRQMRLGRLRFRRR